MSAVDHNPFQPLFCLNIDPTLRVSFVANALAYIRPYSLSKPSLPMSTVNELEPEALEYKLFLTLEGEHSTSITCVAFSPDGLYLACGGEDNKMSIWDASTAEVLHVLTGVSPVLCLSWLNSKQVIIGMKSGGLACATVDKVRLRPAMGSSSFSHVYLRFASLGLLSA